MTQPRLKEQSMPWVLVSARVFKVDPAGVWVRLNTGVEVVQPAESCLLQATPGDQVLLAGSPESYWLLAILQRADQQAAHLQVHGALTIQTSGPLTLNSGEDLLLCSAGNQQITTQNWQLDSHSVKVHCQQASLITRAVQLTTGTLSHWAEQIEQVATRVLQRFGQRLCTVKEHDEQRSGSHRHLVQGSSLLQAETITKKARGHVSIDGQQIHLG
jgi:hypothetical protein